MPTPAAVRTAARALRGRPRWPFAAATVALGALGAVAAWRFGHTMAGGPTPPPDGTFPAGELARNQDYRDGTWTMAVASTVLGTAAAVAVAATAGRWAGPVARLGRGRAWRAGAAFGVGAALAGVLATLPVRAAAYGWGRHFGLITQPPAGWALDVGKATAVSAVVSAVAGSVALVAVVRSPRAWWAWLAGAGATLVVVGSLLLPVVVEPLFQRTRPLPDQALAADIRDLARREGVDARQVLVNDASARTTTANAYVSGFGASRRVVLFDTLLRDFPPREVRVVVAHELAHVKERHVLWGTALGAFSVLPIALIAFGLTGRRRDGRDDVGTGLVRVARAAAVVAVCGVVAAPASNLVSRAMEREADTTALRVTADPKAAEGLYTRLVRTSLAVPDPPAWVRWWFGTHPSPMERIGQARRAAGGG